jgi:hypothetical protein
MRAERHRAICCNTSSSAVSNCVAFCMDRATTATVMDVFTNITSNVVTVGVSRCTSIVGADDGSVSLGEDNPHLSAATRRASPNDMREFEERFIKRWASHGVRGSHRDIDTQSFVVAI